jgi:hypothetical protein
MMIYFPERKICISYGADSITYSAKSIGGIEIGIFCKAGAQ